MKFRRILAVICALAIFAIGIYTAFVGDIEYAVEIGFVFIFLGLLMLAAQIR